MTTEILLQRFKELQDEFGLVQDHKGSITGNGLCFTGEAVITLSQNGIDPEHELMKSFYKGIFCCQLARGFYTRHPVYFTNDQIGPDDHVGLGTYAAICNPHIAEDWIWFGENGWVLKPAKTKIDYYYPNENQYKDDFGWRAYHGKFLALRAHMEWAARREPSLLKKLAWAFSVITARSKKGCEHDEWRLSWQLVSLFYIEKNKSFICEMAARIFRKRLYKRFNNGIKGCFAEYYNDPTHPQAIYAKDNWFDEEIEQ